MNGVHDLGGMHGFGRVVAERDEPVFHSAWERRAFGLVSAALRAGLANTDRFRHAIERIAPTEYLRVGYYGRWLLAADSLLKDWLAGAPLEARGGARRDVDLAPRFRVGDGVRARNLQPAGHTRLPGYARGKRGAIAIVHPVFVLPDTNAHGRGERPQRVYAVRFAARELFGSDAGAHSVCIDLFDDYLEPEPGHG